MSFSVVVFAAALWALSTESVEDALIDLIYLHAFGRATFFRALVLASGTVVAASVVVLLVFPVLLQSYLSEVHQAGGLLLGAIGLFWLASSLRGREDEFREARELGTHRDRGRTGFVLAFQLLAIEEIEIAVIILPLALSSHAAEAALAAAIGILSSLTVAVLLWRRFSRLVKGRFRGLKLVSGAVLLALGGILFFQG